MDNRSYRNGTGEEFLKSSLLLTQIDYLKVHDPDLVESFQRTAISRSYYGVYHIARDFSYRFSQLTKRDRFDVHAGNEHEQLQSYYEKYANNINVPEQKERFKIVATKIADIRSARNDCDYKNNVPYNLSSKVLQIQRSCNKIRESIAGLHLWLDKLENENKE